MFDGVSDQLHQFIASSRASSVVLPLPLSSFPLLHHPSNSTSPHNYNNTSLISSLDSYSHSQLLFQPHLLHQLHQQSHVVPNVDISHKNHQDKENNLVEIAQTQTRSSSSSSIPQQLVPINDDQDQTISSWSNEEILALLRIRSNMENWFPDFTWEYVSRKLAELGFKRSAEKCKQKFDDESRYFNNITLTKNYRILTELEELYHGHETPDQNPPLSLVNPPPVSEAEEENQKVIKNASHEEVAVQDIRNEGKTVIDKNSDDNEKVMMVMERTKIINGKRKRQNEKFEMLKTLCEDIVKKMMVQQEEIHNKLVENMVKRDKEKVEKEEAWKKQEIDKMNKELDIMAKEQSIASDRQITIIEFLKKFASPPSSSLSETQCYADHNSNPNSCSIDLTQNNTIPKLPISTTIQKPSSINTHNNTITPISSSIQKDLQNLTIITNYKDDDQIGKRWPRDEVLALINLRCNFNSNGTEEIKDGVLLKPPLWERISQGMLELGYKRSAKRCKEKWENINKYFRKTKDISKKRSTDSRTCPYFHKLSSLYNQAAGTLNSPQEG